MATTKYSYPFNNTATPDESNNVMNFTIAKGVNDTAPVKTISHNTLNDAFKTIYQTQSSTTVNV